MSTLQPLSFDVFSGDEAALVEKIIKGRSDPSYFLTRPILRHRRQLPQARAMLLAQTKIFDFDGLAPNSVWSNAEY